MLDLNHPKNITTARLMTKKYVKAVLMHKEKHFVISGCGFWLDFLNSLLKLKEK